MPSPALAPFEPATHEHDHLLVRVGGERFAFPLAAVEEAVEEPHVIALPGAPERCLGALRWRGRRVPLHDAAPVFGVPAQSPARVALVICMQAPIAVVVDELLDVTAIAPDEVRPWTCRDDAHRVVSGVAMILGAPVAVVRPESVAAACGVAVERADVAREVAA
ncbi:MAG TPA: chemotaxis protein CheW [Gemmatimonadales bacterium]